MPPLVIASAHTQGTLVSFLQSFESCHGPIAPFSYFTSRFYLCGNVHVFFFVTPTPKFESCCLAVLPHFLSFCSICMLLSLSLFFALIIPSIGGAVFGVYGGAAVLCHWGLLIGVLSMHLFVCCICITGRASWWLLSRLNGLLASNWWLSHSLNLNVLQRVSFRCHPPTFTHFSAVIRQGSGTFSCKDSLLLFLPRYLHMFVESILLLRDWKVFLAPSWC